MLNFVASLISIPDIYITQIDRFVGNLGDGISQKYLKKNMLNKDRIEKNNETGQWK